MYVPLDEDTFLGRQPAHILPAVGRVVLDVKGLHVMVGVSKKQDKPHAYCHVGACTNFSATETRSLFASTVEKSHSASGKSYAAWWIRPSQVDELEALREQTVDFFSREMTVK